MASDKQLNKSNLKKQSETDWETDWENSMRASIQQSLLARMKQDDEKKKQQALAQECDMMRCELDDERRWALRTSIMIKYGIKAGTLLPGDKKPETAAAPIFKLVNVDEWMNCGKCDKCKAEGVALNPHGVWDLCNKCSKTIKKAKAAKKN